MRRYIIPMNFAPEGYAFGNVRWVNLIEACVVVIGLGIPVFGVLPLGLKARIYIGILVLLPSVIITIRGVNDLSITSYLADIIKSRRYGKIYWKPNPVDQIARQRNLEQKKHKRMLEMERKTGKERRESRRLLKGRRPEDEE